MKVKFASHARSYNQCQTAPIRRSIPINVDVTCLSSMHSVGTQAPFLSWDDSDESCLSRILDSCQSCQCQPQIYQSTRSVLGHGPRVECCFRDLSWQSPGWRPEQLMWMVSRQPDALGTGGFPEKSVACCADDTISWCLLGCFSIMTTTMLHERCYRTVCRADTEIHFDPFWFLQFPFMKLRHRQPEATLLKKQ